MLVATLIKVAMVVRSGVANDGDAGVTSFEFICNEEAVLADQLFVGNASSTGTISEVSSSVCYDKSGFDHCV